jgi:hypothetical protein
MAPSAHNAVWGVQCWDCASVVVQWERWWATSVKANKGVIINEEQVEIGPQALKRRRPAPFFILVCDWSHRSANFLFKANLARCKPIAT